MVICIKKLTLRVLIYRFTDLLYSYKYQMIKTRVTSVLISLIIGTLTDCDAFACCCCMTLLEMMLNLCDVAGKSVT